MNIKRFSVVVAVCIALSFALVGVNRISTADAAAIQHIVPSGCSPTGAPCTFSVGSPTSKITVGPTTHGSGQIAVEAVQAPNEVYTESVDIMREAKPGASKAWIAIRHHDSKDKYVLLLKNRADLQFIVELHGVNTTLATAPYVVALNQPLSIELDATGFEFTVWDTRNGGRRLLFTVTDTTGRIPAGTGDALDLYTNAGTQACWDGLTGRPS